MKVSIQVANRDEANMLVAGLADRQVFALVKIVGALSAFGPRAQARIMRYVEDKLADESAHMPIEKGNGGEPRLPGMG